MYIPCVLKYDALCNFMCTMGALVALACTHTDCRIWLMANCTRILSDSLLGICATVYSRRLSYVLKLPQTMYRKTFMMETIKSKTLLGQIKVL